MTATAARAPAHIGELAEGWDPEANPQVHTLLDDIARAYVSEPPVTR